jgi:hypothetical protein
MTLIHAASTLTQECSAVRLARYAQLIGYDERAFFGLYYPNMTDYQCSKIWLKSERDKIQKYLCEAQDEIEQHLGYPIGPKYVTNDEQPYNCLATTKSSHLIAAGIKAETVLQAGAAVDHTNDPAEIDVVLLAAPVLSEIVVYHPGTDIEIPVSDLSWDVLTMTLTISIPRARMVKTALANNPINGWNYNDTTVNGPFEQDVDVIRRYTDTTTQAILHKPQLCSTTCEVTNHAACIQILQGNIGYVRIVSSSLCGCSAFFSMNLYYLAGVELTRQAEDAIIRLAHSKMPEEPCGCEVSQMFWKRDRFVPENIDIQRYSNPFGLSDGAWIAWMFTQAMKYVKGSVL